MNYMNEKKELDPFDMPLLSLIELETIASMEMPIEILNWRSTAESEFIDVQKLKQAMENLAKHIQEIRAPVINYENTKWMLWNNPPTATIVNAPRLLDQNQVAIWSEE